MFQLDFSQVHLRFVPFTSVLLHEEHDPRRVKRMETTLKRDGFLRNPPIAARYGDEYIVLDGVTRTSALRDLGFRDVFLQIVDYESEFVALSTWHHVVVGLSPAALMHEITHLPALSVQPEERGIAYQRLGNKEIIACICTPDGHTFAVQCKGNIDCQAHNLCALVGVYRGKAEVYRTTEMEMPAILAQHPELSAIIGFRAFYPQDIVQIASGGGLVPMGITRHLISGRVLGLNVPLEMLTDAHTLADKNTWLQARVQKCLSANKIRMYHKPVFIFDDCSVRMASSPPAAPPSF